MSEILTRLPSHRMYVELLSGDKMNLMRKLPQFSEVYNDQRRIIVDFFKILRECPVDFKEFIVNNNKEVAEKNEIVSPERWEELRQLFYHFKEERIEGNFKRCSGYRDVTNAVEEELKDIDDTLLYMIRRLRMVQYENRPYKDIIERFDRVNTVFYVDVSRLEDLELTPEELCFSLLKVIGKCIIFGVKDSSRYSMLVDEGWIESIDDTTKEKCWINYRV